MTSGAGRALAVAAVGMAVAGLVDVARADSARVVRIASHISIRHHDLIFSGRVTSPNQGCLDQRFVTLYRTVNYPLGAIRTQTDGRWKITIPRSGLTTHARIYAKVSQSSQGAAGTTYVCRPARSITIRYRAT